MKIRNVYHYRIADCEHRGDVSAAEREVLRLGDVIICESFWDGHDCGEAYIEFVFARKRDEKTVDSRSRVSFGLAYNDVPVEKWYPNVDFSKLD